MTDSVISSDTRPQSLLRAPEPSASGCIVAAIDDSLESLAALNTAFALATARRRSIHVISVIPATSRSFGPGLDKSASEVDSLPISNREVAVRAAIEKVNPRCDWSYEIVQGQVARKIVIAAERRMAGMLVIGKRRQNPLDRLLGGETTLEIVRMTSIPVLAVGDAPFAPTSVVVATDFSVSSTKAACISLELLGKMGSLYLVHVDPGPEPELGEYGPRERRHFPGDFSRMFRKQREKIQAPPGVMVENVTLAGKPADKVLDFARSVSADLIACGPHGRNGLERFLLGSISTAIVRNSSCALLIAPPDPKRGDYR